MDVTVLRDLNALSIDLPSSVSSTHVQVNKAFIYGRGKNVPASTVKVKNNSTWTTHNIEEGHYTILSLLERLSIVDGVTFAYNESTCKVTVVCTKHAKISDELATILSVPTEIKGATFTSTHPVNLNRTPWIIKADFVENSQFNDTYTNLLHVLVDSEVPSKCKTRNLYTSELNFSIHDHDNNPIEFIDGMLYLNLTFKHEKE